MTETSSAVQAAYTLANLEDDSYLQLIESAKTELEALEAGMAGQTWEQGRLQNAMWRAQYDALTDIIRDALGHGVPAAAIMEITHRKSGAWA